MAMRLPLCKFKYLRCYFMTSNSMPVRKCRAFYNPSFFALREVVFGVRNIPLFTPRSFNKLVDYESNIAADTSHKKT